MKEHTQAPQTPREPIAVVGMACRFPGGADSPESYWRLLEGGVDAIRELPPGRWDVDAHYDPTLQTPGKIHTRQGGFLERIDEFDPEFFGISPREAVMMDPQQRLALEVAWEAIEDAGLTAERLRGSQTGVFFGVSTFDYQLAATRDNVTTEPYAATGAAHSILTGRISYVFDLLGPSVAVDTACSSSLVAVDLACRILGARDCDLALVGGVNAILFPGMCVAFSMGGFLSPDGRCKTFDASADGYGRGEGCGVVVLKRLVDALADRDRIWAVIRGSAINQDGRSAGITAPKASSQVRVIRAALANAGVRPEEIGCVEAHGTGTPLGDPIEVEALTEAIGQPRPDGSRCALGTAKTNLGHLEAAAGIAGLIKAALILRHGAIPPSLHFERLNPEIRFDGTPFFVPREVVPWPAQGPRRLVGVSSFGFSGTNAHVVLEEAPRDAASDALARDDAELGPDAAAGRPYLLPISARSEPSLQSLAAAYRDQIRAHATAKTANLAEICAAAGVARTHHGHRLAIIARDAEEAAAALAAFAAGEVRAGVRSGMVPPGAKPRVAFVFSGQGAQWPAMGRDLVEREPEFRSMLEACDEAFRSPLGLSIVEQLLAKGPASRLDETVIAQPVIFSFQVALAALWRSWGIEPAALIGHSLGEVSAAHVAGALSLEQAARLVAERGRLMQEATGRGRMVAIELPAERLQERLERLASRLSVAAVNDFAAPVVSGDTAPLEELVAELEAAGVVCRWLKVDYAFHSPQMEPFARRLAEHLAGLEPAACAIPMISTVTGLPVEGHDLGATYWAQNLREPVRFADAVAAASRNACNAFVELSGHPVLAPSIAAVLRHLGAEGFTIVPSLRRDHDEGVLVDALGALYVAGVTPDFRRRHGEQPRHVALPRYPWNHRRFWYALPDTALDAPPGGGRQVKQPDGTLRRAHPFLARVVRAAAEPKLRQWEVDVGLRAFPFLADHRVEESVVFPGAAYLEAIVAACDEALGERDHVLENVRFERPLVLSKDGECVLQVAFRPQLRGRVTVEIYSRAGTSGFVRHVVGACREAEAPPAGARHDVSAIRSRCTPLAVDEFYARLDASGLRYGAAFRGVRELWGGDGEALGTVALPECVAWSARCYRVHPALLDAAFQVAAAALGDALPGGADGYLPAGVERYRVLDQPFGELSAYAVRRAAADDGAEIDVDVLLLDANGEVVLEARGLMLRRVAQGRAPGIEDWLHVVEWTESRAPVTRGNGHSPPIADPWLVVDHGSGLGAQLVAALETLGEPCVVAVAREALAMRDERVFALDPSDREQVGRLLDEALMNDDARCRGIVYLAPRSEGDEDPEPGVRACAAVLALVQAVLDRSWSETPHLSIVTRGAQAAAPDDAAVAPALAPLWGLGKVVAMEHPELGCRRIDLDPSCPDDDVESLAAELRADDGEPEVALRAARRLVARLGRFAAETVSEAEVPRVPAGERAFRLEIPRPGLLEHLSLREVPRTPPGPGEVEIRVRAASLNFKDVLLAMGVVPVTFATGIPLGGECAGTVVAVGPGVEGLAPGDEVVAVAQRSLARYVLAPAAYTVKRPERLSPEQAASVPLVFMTAIYALEHVGRITAGESILIHAAAGGVGLAAVQVARSAGAEVLATAGSEKKRNYLREREGIARVMDSRTLNFAAEVAELTGGRGVDLVLNSLSGEAILKSLEVLAPFGRFLEIGVRDIYEDSRIGLLPFQRNLTYSAIDLTRLAAERPAQFASLLRQVLDRFASGALEPLPVTCFPIARAEEAFRYMAKAQHIGKIVIEVDDDVLIERLASPASTFDGEATYLITGGLGGLGLGLAEWMHGEGARHLVLLGRRAPSQEAEQRIAALREAGAEVRVAAADVADESALRGVLDVIDREMPPLRGVFHAAGVLDDGVVLQLDEARLAGVMAPKARGAWNLHRLTRQHELEHFVLFSSAASLVGSPGQGNYAAGNAYLDALAHYRLARGLPALSVNWGPWSTIGMAAADARRLKHLDALGVATIEPEVGWYALGRLLSCGRPQVGVLRLDLRRWLERFRNGDLPFFRVLAAEQGTGGGARVRDPQLLKEILALPTAEDRRRFLESRLQAEIGRALGMDPAEIDPAAGFADLGFDSLVAVEFKNRLEDQLGITLSATTMFAHPTLESLVDLLARQLGFADAGDGGAAAEAAQASPEIESVAALSEDSAADLLADEIDALTEGRFQAMSR
jgi:acyl transferase domain-containing protein/acyl carrier protein